MLLTSDPVFFIQGHRFDIFEGIGCIAAVPNSILYFVLYGCWPIAMGLVSACYCVLTLRAFIRRRKQFSELIASNSNLTFNRYFRLMAMAVIEMLSTIPLGIYTVVGNVQIGVYPWKGFADLHLGFSRVSQYPLELWQTTWDDASKRSLEFNQWAFVVCALVFFLIFGMAEEARKHYRAAYTTVAKRVGISTGTIDSSGFGFSQYVSSYLVFLTTSNFNITRRSKGSKVTSSGFGRVTIPTFIQRNASKRDSLTSFSDRLSTISVGDLVNEEKQPYSSAGSSSGSSAYLSSPIDEKAAKQLNIEEIAVPAPVHNAHDIQRHTPDVPSTIRNSVDIV